MPSATMSGALLSPSRRVGWRGIALTVTGYIGLLLAEVTLLGALPHLGRSLAQVSDGILTLPLCISIVVLLGEALVFFVWLRLRLPDVGMVPSHIVGGVIAYGSIWLSFQGVLAVLSLISQGQITLEPFWSQPATYPTLLGIFLTYSLGIALSEELLFRGFLVSQVWQALRGRRRLWERLVVTLAISQGIFTIVHIPAVLSEGLDPNGIALRLGAIFLLGILLALVWLEIQNLFIAVAVHGLADGAIPFVHQTVLTDTSWLALGAAVVLLLVWPLLTGRQGLRDVMRPAHDNGHESTVSVSAEIPMLSARAEDQQE